MEATCFLCQDGRTSLTNFLASCGRLRAFTLRSDRKAVDYAPTVVDLSHLKVGGLDPTLRLHCFPPCKRLGSERGLALHPHACMRANAGLDLPQNCCSRMHMIS